MVEKIKETKDRVLEFMDQELSKYGNGRMDVKQIGELADIVKDLAAAEESCWEAQYYHTVTNAMERGDGSSGYTPMRGNTDRMGYGSGGNMGGTGGRRGYGSGRNNDMMGYSDPVGAIRDMLATSSPEMRAQIRSELSNLMSM